MASPYIESTVGERVVKVTNPDKVYFPGIGAPSWIWSSTTSASAKAPCARSDRPMPLKRIPMACRARRSTRSAPAKPPRLDPDRPNRLPRGRSPTSCASPSSPTSPGAPTSAPSTSTPGRYARADVDHPDELRIDLDPQPGHRLRRRAKVALGPHATCSASSASPASPRPPATAACTSTCASSRAGTFTEVRRAALALAREIERRMPDLVTTAWWKEERGEKVFIDFNQNARDRTIASAYSVRPKPHAPVSAPVTWDELPDVETDDFTIATMPARFAETRRPARHASTTRRSRSSRYWSGPTATSATAAWATCRTRRTTRRWRASPSASSPARRARRSRIRPPLGRAPEGEGRVHPEDGPEKHEHEPEERAARPLKEIAIVPGHRGEGDDASASRWPGVHGGADRRALLADAGGDRSSTRLSISWSIFSRKPSTRESS